jgi:hypothetical protein
VEHASHAFDSIPVRTVSKRSEKTKTKPLLT